jgi:hypothetical protein
MGWILWLVGVRFAARFAALHNDHFRPNHPEVKDFFVRRNIADAISS